MGANTFFHGAKGKTAKDAFGAARREAFHNYGDEGYTGSIAEKDSFVMITCPPDQDPIQYAASLIDLQDPRIDDKWGPAGCIQTGQDEYLFFGWASS